MRCIESLVIESLVIESLVIVSLVIVSLVIVSLVIVSLVVKTFISVIKSLLVACVPSLISAIEWLIVLTVSLAVVAV